MRVLLCSSPRYSEPDNSAIDCDVAFAGVADTVRFTARATDSMDYGRALYAALVAEEWGRVAPYSGG